MIKTKEEIFSLLWDNGKKRMNGWWKDLLFDVYEVIDGYQKENNIKGNIAEIGIFEGRSLIPLANFRSDGELVIGMDNGKWVEDRRYEKYLNEAYGETDDIKLFFESSKNTKRYLDYKPYRMFYVDGDHSTEMTLNDLEVAQEVMSEGGIIFLDDYRNAKHGRNICKAIDFFLSKHSDLNVAFSSGETMFITKNEMVKEYNNLLNEKLHDWIITKDKVYGQLNNFVHPSGYLNYSVKLNKA